MSEKFQKRVENFTCERCGAQVIGDGYTNHCHACLWSKHVDRFPGDRAAECLGMMEPVRIEGSTPDYLLTHRCVRCGSEKRNRAASRDDANALIALARKQAAVL